MCLCVCWGRVHTWCWVFIFPLPSLVWALVWMTEGMGERAKNLNFSKILLYCPMLSLPSRGILFSQRILCLHFSSKSNLNVYLIYSIIGGSNRQLCPLWDLPLPKAERTFGFLMASPESFFFLTSPSFMLLTSIENNHQLLIWSFCPYVCVIVAQLCPTLCDPMDCSPPDSSVLGIFQVRILEWVAISFSGGRGLVFPTQGSNLVLLHWQAGYLPENDQKKKKKM